MSDTKLAFEIYHTLGNPITPEKMDRAYRMGMLRKEDLVDGKSYIGSCRNADVARWDAAIQQFTYIRTKFGDSFEESQPHPENDEGYDIFVPVKEA